MPQDSMAAFSHSLQSASRVSCLGPVTNTEMRALPKRRCANTVAGVPFPKQSRKPMSAVSKESRAAMALRRSSFVSFK